MAVNPDFKCVVSADLFRRTMMAQSTEETRYYLNGVRIEPCPEGGVLLIATDGHRLLVFRDADGFISGGSATISLSSIMARALSAKPWKHPGWGLMPKADHPRRRFVAVHGDRAATVDFALDPTAAISAEVAEAIIDQVRNPTALVGGFQWASAQIDGDYPDWRRVIGEPGEGGLVVPVNLRVLSAVVEALSQSATETGFRLVPSRDDPEGPAFVIPYHDSPGFGVIMPMRPRLRQDAFAPPAPPKVPSWLLPPAKAEAA